MASVGERLKEERSRLGMSQEALGAAADVGRVAQFRYEKGERAPDTDYLTAIAALGVDVGYVVTGHASNVQPEEAELLRRYRAASADYRDAAMAVLAAATKAHPSPAATTPAAPEVTFGGSNSGLVITGGQKVKKQTFNVGTTGKKKRGPSD